MKPHSPCPDRLRLQGLLETSIPEAEQADLVGHLDSCTDCQHSLEEMAAGSSWPGAARAADTPQPPSDSAYWVALRKVENQALARTEITSAPEEADGPDAAAPVSLDFLNPSDRPGSLGRLGDFEVEKVIGRGGMGMVLRAFDPCLQRTVALKVLDPQLAGNETAHKRFCREARAAAAVSHENVVAIYQVDEDEAAGLPFLVMQLVNGNSLQDRLDQEGPLPLKEILWVGLQAAGGLAAAHAKGLIHRDIKPANILLEEGDAVGPRKPHVKITDFGLARAVEDVKLTQTGLVAGTPLYMAPEQARGEPVDHRADLFGLGCVLYACCTGRPPFGGSTPFLVLKSVTEEAPRPVQEINPRIPDYLADLIDRLLAKKPDDRVQSAREVAAVLGPNMVRLLNTDEEVRCPLTGRLMSGRSRRLLRGRSWLLVPVLAFAALGALEVTELTGLTGVNASLAGRFARAPVRAATEEEKIPVRQTLPGKAGPVWAAAFSPDGGTLAMALDEGVVKLFDVADGRVRGTLEGHQGPVWSVEFAPDGKALATASDDATVRIWDPARGEREKVLHHEDSVRKLAFSRDGKRLATGGRRGRVQVWDVATGQVTARTQTHGGVIMALAFSPDGKTVASGGSDKVIRLCDAATGGLRQALTGHEGAVYSLAFSPDGTLLASGGWDHTVRLWDALSGNAVATFTGHTQDVWGVAFSPDGRTLASASEDRTVKLWDVAVGKELATFKGHTGTVYTVTFSADGRTVASGGRDGTVKLWDAVRP
jgi:Tol biopolymer transport system component